MKITIVADVYGEGNNGTSITARRLVESLQKRGHTVNVISSSPESAIILPKRKIPIFQHYVEKTNGVALAEIDEDKLREGIAESDVVHFLLPFKVARRGIKIARELHIPYTTAFHCQPENITSHIGMKNWKLPNKYIYRRFKRRFYKYANFIHCPSQFIADQLEENGYKAKKYVISNGVIPQIKPQPMQKPAKYKDKICIAFVGRFSKEKRQDLLIKAVEMSKYKDKIQLFFAGNGPLRNKIISLSENLPNKPVAEFFTLNDLKVLLNFADLYVHPSDIEIEAISCIEAITCGRVPIISNSKRSATKQFAIDERCLFEAGNAEDLKNKIEYFIEHPEEKEKLSKKYIEYAKQFALENCVDQMEQMFKDAIEYYRDYYDKLPKVTLKPQITYPENPEEHIVHVKKNKRHKVIDENYKYTTKNPFYHIGSAILRAIAWLLLPLWLKPYTHYKIYGKKNLKKVKRQGVIIIANHVHVTDAPLLASRLFGAGRKVRIITLAENMDIPVASSLMTALGTIPLADTLKGMRNFTETVNNLLSNNKPILFFPESSLWPYYRKLRPFHKGAFTFSVKNNVPILPVMITFVSNKKGKQKMRVTILEPIHPNGVNPVELQKYTENCCHKFIEDFYKKYR